MTSVAGVGKVGKLKGGKVGRLRFCSFPTAYNRLLNAYLARRVPKKSRWDQVIAIVVLKNKRQISGNKRC